MSVNKRQAVLFFCVINQGIFASLQTINSFPSERALALRERAAGTYHVSAYVSPVPPVSVSSYPLVHHSVNQPIYRPSHTNT